MKGRSAIDALPELPLEPFEAGGRLAHARRGPYVTVVHPRPAVPAQPPPPPHAKPRAQFETRRYYVQVTYPRVFCSSPGELLDDLVFDPGTAAARPVSPNDPALLSGTERHYKLSALNGVPFRHPLFCTVRSGPWTAFVTETESCTDGVPNHWELAIPGIPEVTLLWYGQWLDQPSFPNLIVIKNNLSLVHVDRACCPGNVWCSTTESCISIHVDCGDTTPA